MTTPEPAQQIAALDEPTLQALQIVAAMQWIPVRDVPLLLGDGVRCLRGSPAAALITLEAGSLRAADPALAEAALGLLTDADRRALHGRLAALDLGPVEVARQRDLSVAAGEDRRLAAVLEEVAVAAERRGRLSVAVEFWARSVARSPTDSTGRVDRELRMAARSAMLGDVTGVVCILDSLEWSSMSREQAERGAALLASAVAGAAGRSAARLRLQMITASLPPDHPHREVLTVALEGLEEDSHRVARHLERSLTTGGAATGGIGVVPAGDGRPIGPREGRRGGGAGRGTDVRAPRARAAGAGGRAPGHRGGADRDPVVHGR